MVIKTLLIMVFKPTGGKRKNLAITQYMMSPIGFVKRHLLVKEKFLMWGFPEYL